MDNVELVSTFIGEPLFQDQFSVVFVEAKIRTINVPALDNAARVDFKDARGGSDMLGLDKNAVAIDAGIEIAGFVMPSDFTSDIEFRRKVTGFFYQVRQSTGEITTISEDAGEFIETSADRFRDDDPQSAGPNPDTSSSSNGIIYDLDAPGFVLSRFDSPIIFVNDKRRIRLNFTQRATMFQNGSRVSCSEDLFWFTRQSMEKKQSSPVVWERSFDIPGDNKIGLGTTLVSEDLQ